MLVNLLWFCCYFYYWCFRFFWKFVFLNSFVSDFQTLMDTVSLSVCDVIKRHFVLGIWICEKSYESLPSLISAFMQMWPRNVYRYTCVKLRTAHDGLWKRFGSFVVSFQLFLGRFKSILSGLSRVHRNTKEMKTVLYTCNMHDIAHEC